MENLIMSFLCERQQIDIVHHKTNDGLKYENTTKRRGEKFCKQLGFGGWQMEETIQYFFCYVTVRKIYRYFLKDDDDEIFYMYRQSFIVFIFYFLCFMLLFSGGENALNVLIFQFSNATSSCSSHPSQGLSFWILFLTANILLFGYLLDNFFFVVVGFLDKINHIWQRTLI